MSNTTERRLTEDQLRELHRAMHYWTSPLLVGEPCARRRPQRRVPDNPFAASILEIRRKRGDRPGFVYFARCEAFVKIGYASNLINRLAAIETNNPFPLVLLGWFKGSVATERAVQAALAPFKHRFEWFRYEPELAEAIRLSTYRPSRYAKFVEMNEYPRELAINSKGALTRNGRER